MRGMNFQLEMLIFLGEVAGVGELSAGSVSWDGRQGAAGWCFAVSKGLDLLSG